MATKIHNILFYKPKPNGIHFMSFNENQAKLAVVRSNSSIEIWSLRDSPYIEREISTVQENNAIQGLAWCDNRLFSIDLEGFLIEYDLFMLTGKMKKSVTGGQAYSIDTCKINSNIAVGTEQGYINIFSLKRDDNEIYFNKFMDKQEGRILCLKYHRNSKIIVSGSIDAIRVWNVKTGQALHKMTFGRLNSKSETLVLCLHVFSDLTLVSGDSRGKLTFWDGQVGAQLESYQSHKAGIFSLCVSDDEKTLYCSGVDPNIIMYSAVNIKDERKKWVKSIQRKVHEHDVRGLILQGNRLYSGSIDGYLACSYYPPKTLIKYPPLLNYCGNVCAKKNLILLRHSQHLEVWSLGQESFNCDSKQGTTPSTKGEPKRLLVVQKSLKLQNDVRIREGIICCDISQDGNWIVMGTDSTTRLFRFETHSQKQAKLFYQKKLEPSIRVCFSNFQLIVAPRQGNLEVYNLNDKNIELNQTLDTGSLLTDTITFILLSACGSYLVAADPQSNIVVWKITKKQQQWKYKLKLPIYKSSPIALSFRPNSCYLACVYADNKIIEFDIENKCLTSSSRTLEEGTINCFHKLTAIRNVTFASDQDAFVLHDDSSIFVINPQKNELEPPSKKIQTSTEHKPNIDVKTINKFKHIAFAKFCNNDLVIVQVDPADIIKELPPCMRQKKCFAR